MGEFWDTHDFTQFDTDAPVVSFTISSKVAIEPELLAAAEEQAHLCGGGVETSVLLAEKYLTARAERGNQAAFLAALAQVPDVEPEKYDRLPIVKEG